MLRLRIPLNIEAKYNKTVVWKKGNMKYDDALRFAKIKLRVMMVMIWRCASKLRNDTTAVQMKQIFEPVTVDNIMEGEAIPPVSVKILFKMIYTGNVSTTEELSEISVDRI